MMLQGNRGLPQITGEVLDKAEEANMKLIEYLEGESEVDFMEAVEELVKNYNQREVLGYVVEALMEESDEECLIRDEYRGMMMIYLKTVIDCLDG